MPLRKIQLRTTAESPRLDQFLAEALTLQLARPISRGFVRKIIMAGAVYLNGSRVRIASKPLRAQARVDVWLDEAKMNSAPVRGQEIEITAEQILFEDDYILAVDKPAGLPSQATLDNARDHLGAAVKRFLKKRDGSADPYLALHHRLDRDTTGVLVLAKHKDANLGLSQIFAGRLAKKTYQALAELPSNAHQSNIHRGEKYREGDSWKVENYLLAQKRSEKAGHASPVKSKQSKMQVVQSGGDHAVTEFKVLGFYPENSAPGGLWIQAQPQTGRMHQIRVHLAECGLPIFADTLYGASRDAAARIQASRIMLHAASLTFPHPIHKNEITISSAPPGDFQQCLQRLQKSKSHPGPIKPIDSSTD